MKRDALSSENQTILSEYVLEGLIEDQFQPQGESDREKRRSIEAKAYTTWIRQHPHLCFLPPEELRETFCRRHTTPEPLEPAMLSLPVAAPPIKSDRALPRGDAWEAPEPKPAEDEPPPPEVS